MQLNWNEMKWKYECEYVTTMAAERDLNEMLATMVCVGAGWLFSASSLFVSIIFTGQSKRWNLQMYVPPFRFRENERVKTNEFQIRIAKLRVLYSEDDWSVGWLVPCWRNKPKELPPPSSTQSPRWYLIVELTMPGRPWIESAEYPPRSLTSVTAGYDEATRNYYCTVTATGYLVTFPFTQVLWRRISHELIHKVTRWFHSIPTLAPVRSRLLPPVHPQRFFLAVPLLSKAYAKATSWMLAGRLKNEWALQA